MSSLSSYSPAGVAAVTDQVAKQIRRLGGLQVINVLDYMTDAEATDVINRVGSLDVSAACQAAIDAAITARVSTVYMPPGIYKWGSTVYLDPTGNLRSTPTAPTIFNFSLTLTGPEHSGNHENHGVWIKTTMTTASALWIGPGQGMCVKNMTFYFNGTNPADHYLIGSARYLSANCAGISISGGGGGSSRTLIEQVGVEGYHTGIDASRNIDQLGDSITLRKCWIVYCNVGFWTYGTQNYIVNIDDCSIGNCATAVKSIGTRVVVTGGNFSADATGRFTGTIGTISTFTRTSESAIGGNTVYAYTFTGIVSSPPTDQQYAVIYDIAAIKTTSYGVIPLEITSWNSGTNTGTFKILSSWIIAHFPYEDLLTVTDIETEVRAATRIYMGTRVRVFLGGGIHCRGLHVENSLACTTLLDVDYGGNASRANVFDGVYFNSDAGAGPLGLYPVTSTQYAIHVLQQSFPFIRSLTDARFVSCQFRTNSPPYGPIIVEYLGNGNRTEFIQCLLPTINNRQALVDNADESIIAAADTRCWGGPFIDRYSVSVPDNGSLYKRNGLGAHPYFGSRPAPYTIPRVLPSQITAVTTGGDTSQAPFGEGYYQVTDFRGGARQYAFVRSKSIGYSYPSDITLTGTASIKGHSPVLNFTSYADCTKMFPGLYIIINDGSTDRAMVVTGVYPTMNYVTVCAVSANAGGCNFGTSGTTYTVSMIKQQGVQLQKFGRQCEFAAAAPTGASVTYAVGDIVYNTAPATGGYVGWVCTVAGAPGTWKPYGLIA